MAMPPSSFLLPAGFRFHPTDEELILHYLRHKSLSLPLPVPIIKDLDLYKFDPWELPGMAEFGEKEWYFFSHRERKYPNGDRPNRAASSGFWKATGSDKPIFCSSNGIQVGLKKALVFYRGKPPKGEKTDWIMHEYRLPHYARSPPRVATPKSVQLDDWVLCRIYKKRSSTTTSVEPTTWQFEAQNELLPPNSLQLYTMPEKIDLSPNTYGSYDINTFFDNISCQHPELSSSNQRDQYTHDYDPTYLNHQYFQDSTSRSQIDNFQPMSSSKLNEVFMKKLLNINMIRAHDNIMQEETLFNIPDLIQMSGSQQDSLYNLPNLELTHVSPSQQFKQYQSKQASVNNVNSLFMSTS